MKSLSMRSALRCETATGKRCRCRCGGALHGSLRAKTEAEIEALPADDPHHVLSRDRRRNRRRKQPRFDVEGLR